jgi:hypothetical protein
LRARSRLHRRRLKCRQHRLSSLAILVSVVFLAFLTAALTSSMTVQQLRGDINRPEDLPGKRVNEALLKPRENGVDDAIHSRWFGAVAAAGGF